MTLGLVIIFRYSIKSSVQERKIGQLNFLKNEYFCSEKDTVRRMKRGATEKISSEYILIKNFGNNIQTAKMQQYKTNNPIKTWVKN